MSESESESGSQSSESTEQSSEASESSSEQSSSQSTSSGETPVGEVADDQLPEELQPDEDNPLARHPGETGNEDDVIGGDREGDPETAPLTEEDADYGSGGSSAT